MAVSAVACFSSEAKIECSACHQKGVHCVCLMVCMLGDMLFILRMASIKGRADCAGDREHHHARGQFHDSAHKPAGQLICYRGASFQQELVISGRLEGLLRSCLGQDETAKCCIDELGDEAHLSTDIIPTKIA